MVFSEIVGTLSFLKPQSDDDVSDRLHYYYTTTFLLLTALLISLKMFGGNPVDCVLPAEFPSSWEHYTEMICWARSTYYTSFAEEQMPEEEERKKRMVAYYQWVPFYLVCCAFMFYAPCCFWRILYDKSGIRLMDIMAFASDKSNIQPVNRRANVNGLAAHLSSVFQHRFSLRTEHPYHHRIFRFLNMRFYEAYLCLLYILVKCCYLVNVILQMYLLNIFLQTDSSGFHGYGVIWDLLQGQPWAETKNFPVVTFCDVQLRVLGNVQRHTVQCVLIINIFVEKVFIFLWLWYTVLSLLSIFSIFSWLFSTLPLEQRKKFIARRLEMADVNFRRQEHGDNLDRFVREYVKIDGVFVLKMLTVHSGLLMCTEVVDTMWEQFLAQQGEQMIAAMLDDQTKKSRYYDESTTGGGADGRAASAAAQSYDVPMSRKRSVLVPLMSREDLTQLPASQMAGSATPQPTDGHFLRPPSRFILPQ